MIQAYATGRYIRTSAQKAKLVLDLIRGSDVDGALATLRFTRKAVAKDIEKVLRSAIANAQQKQGFGGDVDRLYISSCYANQGPSMKRVRPAPMGRAFRIVKRTAHLTVQVVEHPLPVAKVPAESPQPGKKSVRQRTSGSRKSQESHKRESPNARKVAAGRSRSSRTVTKKKTEKSAKSRSRQGSTGKKKETS